MEDLRQANQGPNGREAIGKDGARVAKGKGGCHCSEMGRQLHQQNGRTCSEDSCFRRTEKRYGTFVLSLALIQSRNLDELANATYRCFEAKGTLE